MNKELYIQIKEFLREVIRGTEFEEHVTSLIHADNMAHAEGRCIPDQVSMILTLVAMSHKGISKEEIIKQLMEYKPRKIRQWN